MYRKLFHKDLFMPNNTQSSCNQLQSFLTNYKFSTHFKEHLDNQLIEDRKHRYLKDVVIECLDTLKDNPKEVFEVELSKDYHFFGKPGWFVTKYCCRIPYDNNKDLVVAIRPIYNKNVVEDNLIVTAWINHKKDNHCTLDKTKYCSEEEWKIVTAILTLKLR